MTEYTFSGKLSTVGEMTYTPAEFSFRSYDIAASARVQADGSIYIDNKEAMMQLADAAKAYFQELREKIEQGTLFGTNQDGTAVYCVLFSRIAELELQLNSYKLRATPE